MIEATQRRLRGAQFFYRRLVAEQKRPSINEPEAFRYYFGAFIVAARSIPWTMQKEEKEKYDAWLPKWEAQLKPDERELLKLTNKLRVDEVHHTGAEFIVEMEDGAVDELLLSAYIVAEAMRAHPAFFGQHSAGPPKAPPPKTKRAAYYLEHEGGKSELTAICRRYLDYLEKMVGDFLSAHA